MTGSLRLPAMIAAAPPPRLGSCAHDRLCLAGEAAMVGRATQAKAGGGGSAVHPRRAPKAHVTGGRVIFAASSAMSRLYVQHRRSYAIGNDLHCSEEFLYGSITASRDVTRRRQSGQHCAAGPGCAAARASQSAQYGAWLHDSRTAGRFAQQMMHSVRSSSGGGASAVAAVAAADSFSCATNASASCSEMRLLSVARRAMKAAHALSDTMHARSRAAPRSVSLK